jgi:hypothetical protein
MPGVEFDIMAPAHVMFLESLRLLRIFDPLLQFAR